MAKPRPESMPSEILDRLPPQDLAAERGVVGAILLDPAKADDVAAILRPEHFYADANRRLYERLQAMRDAGVGIDTTTLSAALRESNELEAVGGIAYLAEVLSSVPVAAHARHHAETVVGHARRRAIIEAAIDALRDAWDPTTPPADIVARLDARLSLIGAMDAAGEPRAMADLVPEALAEIDAAAERQSGFGVATGLPKIDQHIGGLFPGELTILAARPGVGKTSLALQIAHYVAQRRLVYVASLEMGDRELTTRLLCSLGGVSSKRVRTGQLERSDVAAIAQAGADLSGARMLIHDRPNLTVSDIRRAARRIAQRDLGLVVIDYLGLVAVPDRRGKRYEQVGDIIKGFKSLARELEIPVLCLAQLNRQTDAGGKPQRPRLTHLRESGDIEQTADSVWFLHRDEPANAGERVTRTLFDVAKNRNSEAAGLWLEWNAERTRYDAETAKEWDPNGDF